MSRFSAILQRFAGGGSGVELVYTSHARWPLPRGREMRFSNGHDYLAISVLDSSFNPPTTAHLALARISRTSDAKLLLFSMQNADKTLKPGDATPSQRLDMMILIASELEKAGERLDQSPQNIAVAVCQEPTFVGKSTALTFFLRERLAVLSTETTFKFQLSFLLGFDTLERLFTPRYYGSQVAMDEALRHFLSPAGDNSRVVCARRSSGASYSQRDTTVLDVAAEFVESGAVLLVDIGENERTLSSSEIRESIRGSSGVWEPKVPPPIVTYIKENSLYQDYNHAPA